LWELRINKSIINVVVSRIALPEEATLVSTSIGIYKHEKILNKPK
jgi:hypothetical protein